MPFDASFYSIKTAWLDKANNKLHGDRPAPEMIAQLERFFDSLCQAGEAENPGLVDPVLDDWAFAQTSTDLEAPASALGELIHNLFEVTLATIRENLADAAAVEATGWISPLFGLLYLKAAQKEIITKTRYLTRKLEATQQRLETLERSRMDFIAVAGHELKTPLTLIDGYAAMLNESSSGLVSDFQKTLLDGILNGTTRLRAIIDDMIDVSLIDNGILTLNYQPLWLGQLLALLESEIRTALQDRKQQLEILPFQGVNEMTFGDPEKLLQALSNVLTNAIKFTPDGGKITISGRKLTGFIELAIHDTGIGIAPENLNIIFEKFVRFGNTALHSSGKTKFKGGGPGLGLYIAKGFIEAHGGTIWVDSPGFDELTCPGSTFHIFLPLRPEPPDSRTAQLYAPIANQGQTPPK